MSIKITLLFLITFYSLVFPQNNNHSKDTVYTLEPVVVSARAGNSILHIPYSIDLVDSAQIQNSIKGMSLSEVLDQVPGLIVSNRNNPSLGDRITLRGIGSRASFGVRGIKIIYDGIPLTFADGQAELNNLDFSSIGSIEVIHGPASALYGNAAGGVINIKSQKPSLKSILINPSITAGSFGLQNYNIKVSGTVSRFSYLLSFNRQLYDGFREHSSASTVSLNSILSYRISDNIKINTIINYFSSPYLLNPSSLTKEDAQNSPKSVRSYIISQGAGEKVWEANYGVTLSSSFDENFTNKTTIYFIRRSLLNPIPGTIIDLSRKAGGFRTFFEKKLPGIFQQARLNLSGGLDFEFQNDLRKEYANNGLRNTNISPEDIFNNLQYGSQMQYQKEKVMGTAPFISAELMLNKKIEFRGGLRYDNYQFKVDDYLLVNGNSSGERRMSSLSPMGGLVFLPLPYLKIYANYATSFQTPTANELSNTPSGSDGFNPSLEPEKIKSYEIGTWGILSQYNLNFQAALFIMNFDNMIISYQSQNPGSEEIFYKNAGKAENTGGEIKLTWNPTNEISVAASYTKMNFTFKDYLIGYTDKEGNYKYKQAKGNYVPGIPQNYFTAELKYNPPFNLFFNLKAEWYDKYFTNDFNGPAPGSNSPIEDYINNNYFKVDLILGCNLALNSYEVNIYAGINNIFDKRYNASIVPNAAGKRFFEPAAERNFYVRAGIKL